MESLIDTTEQDKKREKAETRANRDASDLRFILKSPEGRRLLWRILGWCGLWQEDPRADTNTTFVSKGKRIIGLMLLNNIFRVKPEAFLQMQNESKAEKTSEEHLEKIEQEDRGLI